MTKRPFTMVEFGMVLRSASAAGRSGVQHAELLDRLALTAT
jgi:hypothetical protein